MPGDLATNHPRPRVSTFQRYKPFSDTSSAVHRSSNSERIGRRRNSWPADSLQTTDSRPSRQLAGRRLAARWLAARWLAGRRLGGRWSVAIFWMPIFRMPIEQRCGTARTLISARVDHSTRRHIARLDEPTQPAKLAAHRACRPSTAQNSVSAASWSPNRRRRPSDATRTRACRPSNETTLRRVDHPARCNSGVSTVRRDPTRGMSAARRELPARVDRPVGETALSPNCRLPAAGCRLPADPTTRVDHSAIPTDWLPRARFGQARRPFGETNPACRSLGKTNPASRPFSKTNPASRPPAETGRPWRHSGKSTTRPSAPGESTLQRDKPRESTARRDGPGMAAWRPLGQMHRCVDHSARQTPRVDRSPRRAAHGGTAAAGMSTTRRGRPGVSTVR